MKTKIAGFALMGVLAMMVIPSNVSVDSSNPTLYGAATMVIKDAAGQELLSQIVHNRVVNEGENFLTWQTFYNATSPTDGERIGAICISDDAVTTGIANYENHNATGFDTRNTLTLNSGNCKTDLTNMTSVSTAIIQPAAFDAPTNLANGETIRSIGICQADTGSGTYNACVNGNAADTGILFAFIDTNDVTLNSGETVDITYTFDITSPSD